MLFLLFITESKHKESNMSWGLNCKQYKMFYCHIKYLLLITVNIIIQITLDSKKLQKRNLRRQISKTAHLISSYSSYTLDEFVTKNKVQQKCQSLQCGYTVFGLDPSYIGTAKFLVSNCFIIPHKKMSNWAHALHGNNSACQSFFHYYFSLWKLGAT